MKTSDKLYNLNRQISWKFIAQKQIPTNKEMMIINQIIGEAIKEIRELEDTVKQISQWLRKENSQLLTTCME